MKVSAKISIIILFVTILTGCYKNIEFVGLESFDVSPTSQNIKLYVKVNNPNFYSIKIVETDLDIYLNDKHLGEIQGEHKIKIPANKDYVAELPIKVNLADLLFNAGNFKDLLKDEETIVKVQGTITGKVFFFKKTININEETNISLYK